MYFDDIINRIIVVIVLLLVILKIVISSITLNNKEMKSKGVLVTLDAIATIILYIFVAWACTELWKYGFHFDFTF